MMRVLLHTCCGPCMIYPVQRLREQGMAVTAFFYNPNIHPLAEYEKRRDAVVGYAKKLEIELMVPDYDPVQFFHAVHGMEKRLQRCPICWYQRLKETARVAAELGFDEFTTTLLVSPYQDHEALRTIGEELAQEQGVAFHYDDFRAGFRSAQEEARREGIYRQKYCGCLYSEIERYDKEYEPGKTRIEKL